MLRLLQTPIVRGRVQPEGLSVQDPAEEGFDALSDSGNWRPCSLPVRWGQRKGWTAFRAIMRVPENWREGTVGLSIAIRAGYRVPVRIDDNYPAGPEGQVFVDGKRLGAIDAQHDCLRGPFVPGRVHEVRAIFFAGRCDVSHELEQWALEWIDSDAERFYHDFRVLVDVAELCAEADPERERLLTILEKAAAFLDTRGLSEIAPVFSEAFHRSLSTATEMLNEAWRRDGRSAAGLVRAVGHAHIDLAWLWPIRQTRHKCVRTFATQCRLLEQYPEYVFLQSQPQAYVWVEHDAPDVFSRIRSFVAEGRWDAEGASWVEMDTNLPGQESLVRQLIYGKRYFREKFGVESRVLWLPDSFGFSAALPQLMRLAGVDALVTTKISWNQYNRFPFDTFAWRGLDGSTVVAQIITAPWTEWSQYFSNPNLIYTYNVQLTVKEVAGAWKVYQGKGTGVPALVTFGWGDGGGGPTETMIETGKRLQRLCGTAEVPELRIGRLGLWLDEIVKRRDVLPIWDGELYLEYHRGTYTTQAWLKRLNRKNEIRLHNLEWLAVTAQSMGFIFDGAAARAMWEDLLLCQFHDILPGSSVAEVYRDEVRPMQERIMVTSEKMTSQAAEQIVTRIDTSHTRKPVVLFNTLSWNRGDPVRLPDGTWRDDIIIPAGGWTVVDAAEPPAPSASSPRFEEDGRVLINDFWFLRLGSNGEIVELTDRIRQRSIIAPGACGNEWQLFEDRPLENDAWDIDLSYEDRRLPPPRLISLKGVESGPVRAAVELCWEVPGIDGASASILRQEMVIYRAHPRIDFRTEVDWNAHHLLLKVAFAVAIRSHEATYETQFGHIRRPTHTNTSWDVARFEVCAHRFVDLSEHGYGVALLNDCKYGFDAHGCVLRMSCIKSPQMPDGGADQGRHEFVYALLPHVGTFQEGGVLSAAAELNNAPLSVVTDPHRGDLPPSLVWITCDTPAVIVDTLKPAEDGDGFIIRIYEAYGWRGRVCIQLALPLKAVSVVNLLEEPCRDECLKLAWSGKSIEFDVYPFQIISFRVHI